MVDDDDGEQLVFNSQTNNFTQSSAQRNKKPMSNYHKHQSNLSHTQNLQQQNFSPKNLIKQNNDPLRTSYQQLNNQFENTSQPYNLKLGTQDKKKKTQIQALEKPNSSVKSSLLTIKDKSQNNLAQKNQIGKLSNTKQKLKNSSVIQQFSPKGSVQMSQYQPGSMTFDSRNHLSNSKARYNSRDSKSNVANQSQNESRAMRILRARQEKSMNRNSNHSLADLLNFDSNKMNQNNSSNLKASQSQANINFNSKVMTNIGLKDTKITPQKNLIDDDFHLKQFNSGEYSPSQGSKFDLHSMGNQSNSRNKRSKDRSAKQAKSFGNVDSCLQRLIEDEYRRKDQRARLEEQKKENELNEAQANTYQPRLMSAERRQKNPSQNADLAGNMHYQSSQKKRSYRTFYEDQLEFKNKILTTRQMQHDEEELRDLMNGRTAHVKTSKNSQLIVEKLKESQREGTPEVHDRLYQNMPLNQQSARKISKHQQAIENKSPNCLKKKVSPRHQQEVMDRLYNENSQRQQSKNKLKEKWDSLTEIQRQPHTNHELNHKIVYDKLKKDFANFFNKEIIYNSNQSESLLNDKTGISPFKNQKDSTPKSQINDDLISRKSGKNTIDLLKKGTPLKLKNYIRLMHTLGFIHVTNRSSSEEEMLTEIWKILGGTNDNMVKAENLFVLLAGIMNIQLPDLVQKHTKKEAPHMGHRINGCLCYDQFNNAHFISFDDITKANTKFMILSQNRKNQKKKKLNSSTQRNQTQDGEDVINKSDDPNFTFTPRIDPKSKSIAEAKFRNTLNQISHHESLLQQAQHKKILKNKAQEEFIKQEMAKCSFKPYLISKEGKKKKGDQSGFLDNSIESKSPMNFQNSRKAAQTMKYNLSASQGFQENTFADLVKSNNKTEMKEQKISPTKTLSTQDTRLIRNFQVESNYEQEYQQNLNNQILNNSGDQIVRPSRKDIVELANQNLMLNRSINNQLNNQEKDMNLTARSNANTDIDLQSRSQNNLNHLDQTSMNSSMSSQVYLNLNSKIILDFNYQFQRELHCYIQMQILEKKKVFRESFYMMTICQDKQLKSFPIHII
eukprot:403333083